jgi:hypothetical protein
MNVELFLIVRGMIALFVFSSLLHVILYLISRGRGIS